MSKHIMLFFVFSLAIISLSLTVSAQQAAETISASGGSTNYDLDEYQEAISEDNVERLEVIGSIGFGRRINDLTWSPRGGQLAVASDQGVYVYDRNLEAEQALRIGDSVTPSQKVVFSGDGDQLIYAGDDGAIRYWDLNDEELAAIIPESEATRGGIRAMATDASNNLLVTNSDDTLWYGLRGRVNNPLDGVLGSAASPVVSVALSPNGQLAIVGYENGVLRGLAQPEGENAVRLYSFPQSGSVTSIVFRPDGLQMATGSSDGSLRLWSPGGGVQQQILYAPDNITDIDYSDDGSLLAAAARDGSVTLWDVASATRIARIDAHENRARAVAFRPGGQELATADANGLIKLWNVSTAEQITERSLALLDWRLDNLQLDPSGDRLLTSGINIRTNEATMTVWTFDGEPVGTLGSNELLTGATFYNAEPFEDSIIGIGAEGRLLWWDWRTGELLNTQPADLPTAISEAFVAYFDNEASAVQLWLTASQEIVFSLEHDGGASALALSDNNTRLGALRVEDGRVRTWETTTGALIADTQTDGTPGTRLVLSPDGEMFAAAVCGTSEGCINGNIYVREVDGDPESDISGHNSEILSMVFSPDGSLLATGGNDGALRIWDTSSGTLVINALHNAPVRGVAFSEDGRVLMTVSAADRSDVRPIRLFGIEPAEEE